MAKWQIDASLDTCLDYLKTNVTIAFVCTAQPATYAEASTLYDGAAGKYKCADKALDLSGVSIQDGVTSGRRLTVTQMENIDVDVSATVNHLALCSATTLLWVTTIDEQAWTYGDKRTIPAWDIEIRDVQ